MTGRRLAPACLGAALTAAVAAAPPSVDLLPHLAAEPGVGSPASGGGLALLVDAVAVIDLRLPAGARLEVDLEPDPRRAVGDGFRVLVSLQAEGGPRETLRSLSYGGLPRGGPSSHVLDLSRLGGRFARLSIGMFAGERGSSRGDACTLRGLRLSGIDAAEVADAVPAFVPETAPRGVPSGPRPGFVLALMDALRASDLGCYGEPRPTSPHLDRLSRRGAILARSFAQAPNTPPSVKSLLTGRYLPTTGHSVLPDHAETIPELLAAAGYRTAAFANTPFVGPLMGTHQGFGDLDASLYVAREDMYATAPPRKAYAFEIAAAFGRWLPDGDFFAYLHTVHPHNPYTALPPWDRLLAAPAPGPYDGTTATLMAVERGKIPPDPEGVGRRHRLLYQQDVAAGDMAMGHVLAELRRRGREDRTVVALVADHGEEFLEHGGILHGYTAFDEMLQVPGILAGHGIPAGRLVDGLTESIDVTATFLDLAGVPFPPGMEGRTLRPLLEGRLPPRRQVYASASSAPGIYSVRTDRYKYVYAPGRTEGAKGGDEPPEAEGRKGPRRLLRRERVRGPGLGNYLARRHERAYLHDLESDPGEVRNVVASHPITAAFLHRRLQSWLAAAGKGGARSGSTLEETAAGMPQEECERLVALGYLEAAQCPCACDRLRHAWPARRDGTLEGPLARALEEQLGRCPGCRQEYEAWAGALRP